MIVYKIDYTIKIYGDQYSYLNDLNTANIKFVIIEL